MNHRQYWSATCKSCGQLTTRKYAREHDGRCKMCTTGEQRREVTYPCPDCTTGRITKYQKDHGYHCDQCTKTTDPEGYMRELRGLND